MYAIIEDSGTQIHVSEGAIIRVALRDLPDENAAITFDKVLLVGDEAEGGQTKIGQPYLDGATVTADVLAHKRRDKVNIVKFRRRKNYRRKNGHRQDYLEVKVSAITA